MAVSAALVAELNRLGKKAEKGLPVGVKEFNAAVMDYADNILPQQFVVFHKWLAMELLRRVVLKTPVDTGRARGNWQVSIDSPIMEEISREDRSGGQSVGVEGSKLGKVYFGCVVWLTNNVPYIVVLEGGWSGQAPVGMLAVSLAEVAQSVRRVA